jgi:non-homologous end joining protein Ku
LVNIPIKLYSATEDRVFSFNQLFRTVIGFSTSDGVQLKSVKCHTLKSRKDMKFLKTTMS